MKLSYENVYRDDGPNPTPFALAVLYTQLEQRTPEQNISHQAMPTWDNHCAYVKAKPHKFWYLIYQEIALEVLDEEGKIASVTEPSHVCLGQIYLSRQNEIGIAILPEHRHKGFAEQAIQWLIEKVKTGPFLANINPSNKPSIDLFEKLGFTLHQVTYILNPQFYADEEQDPIPAEQKRLVPRRPAVFDETKME